MWFITESITRFEPPHSTRIGVKGIGAVTVVRGLLLSPDERALIRLPDGLDTDCNSPTQLRACVAGAKEIEARLDSDLHQILGCEGWPDDLCSV